LARNNKPRAAAPAFPPEERRAEVATVAWMLCALFTFCAEGVGLVARIGLAYAGEAEPRPAAWSVLPDVTLVMALVTGALCLVLTGVVHRLRKTPPPLAITVVTVLLGLTPWARVILAWLRGN
jgi:hypothetical protein